MCIQLINIIFPTILEHTIHSPFKNMSYVRKHKNVFFVHGLLEGSSLCRQLSRLLGLETELIFQLDSSFTSLVTTCLSEFSHNEFLSHSGLSNEPKCCMLCHILYCEHMLITESSQSLKHILLKLNIC